MSSSEEKINHAEHDDVRSTKDLKEILRHKAAMFVCEKNVTQWIAPKSRRNNQ